MALCLSHFIFQTPLEGQGQSEVYGGQTIAPAKTKIMLSCGIFM